MRRLVTLGLVVLGTIGILLAFRARPASAQPLHPLGNFSVNQAIGLDLYPDRVDVTAIVDLAESAAYNSRVCDAMAREVALHVDDHRVQWSVRPAGFEYRPGSAGLHTSRI